MLMIGSEGDFLKNKTFGHTYRLGAVLNVPTYMSHIGIVFYNSRDHDHVKFSLCHNFCFPYFACLINKRNAKK